MSFTDIDNSLNQDGNTIGSEDTEVSLEREEALLRDNASYQEPTRSPEGELAANPGAPINATVSRPDSGPPAGNNFRQDDVEMETGPTMIPTAYVRPHHATTMTSEEQLVPVLRDAHTLITSIYSAGDRGATQLLPRKTMQSIRAILHHITEQIRLLTPDITGTQAPATQHHPATHPATYPRNRTSMCRQCNNPWPCKDTSCPSWLQAVKTKKDRMERRAVAKERAADTETSPIPAGQKCKLIAVDEQGRAYKLRKPSSHGLNSHLSRLSLKNNKIHKRHGYIRQQRRSESGQSSSDEPREKETQRAAENSGYVSQDEPRIVKEVKRNPNSGHTPLNKPRSSRKMQNFFMQETKQTPSQLQQQR